jgi:hypothetical protein
MPGDPRPSSAEPPSWRPRWPRARLAERLGTPPETLGEGDSGYRGGVPFRTALVR